MLWQLRVPIPAPQLSDVTVLALKVLIGQDEEGHIGCAELLGRLIEEDAMFVDETRWLEFDDHFGAVGQCDAVVGRIEVFGAVWVGPDDLERLRFKTSYDAAHNGEYSEGFLQV